MSKFKAIHSANAPKAIGPYSQATQSNQFLFLSGQIGIDPNTQKLVSGGVEEEIRQVFTNLQHVLYAAGGNLSNILKLTIYLKDLDHFAVVNEIMKGFFIEPYPARATIEIARLPVDALVEIDAIAFIS